MRASRHLTSGSEMLREKWSCHHIRTRGTADNVYVDLHVHVREDIHMDKAHCIAHAMYPLQIKG